MLCNANLHDRVDFAMWSLKFSWSSKILPRFLTELDGVIKGFPVAQMVEHGASNAKIMGSIPRESKSWSNVKL